MKVSKLYVQFIKGIREIKIYARKGLNEVAGPNESGKTTLLDAVKWAFGGKKLMDGKPVHEGKHEGSIIVETDDGLVIRQRIRNDGKVSVSIRGKDGEIYGQSHLNQAFSKLSFDPLSFSNMKPSDQIQVIESFAGEEFLKKRSDLQTQIENVFDTRRMDKRLLVEAGEPEPVEKVEPVDVDQIIAEAEDIDLHNKEVQEHNAKRRRIKEQIGISKASEGNAEKRIEQLKRDLANLEQSLETFRRETRHAEKLLDEVGPRREEKSKDEVNKKLAASVETNAKALKYEEYLKKVKSTEALRRKIKTSTETLDYLREALNDHMSSVKLPVEGLTLDGKDILVKGIPWNQLSKSQKIRYSAYIGMHLNKKLKIMFIYDGSLLDEENLKVLTDIVEERDYQLWIETVGKGRTKDAIVLEAGEVKEGSGVEKPKSLDDKAVQ